MTLTRPILVCMMVLVAYGFGGCGNGEVDKSAETEGDLYVLAGATLHAILESDQYAPTNEREYVIWLMEYEPNVKKWTEWGTILFDPERYEFLDAWHRKIVLVTESGELTGLGSSGENGQWENGKGDDIVVSLRNLEAPVGPPGARWRHKGNPP